MIAKPETEEAFLREGIQFWRFREYETAEPD